MPQPQKVLPFLHYQTQIKVCDQCNARKLKCDRQHPCGRCTDKSLTCTFDKVHRRRGPAGSRISELRRAQTASHEVVPETFEYRNSVTGHAEPDGGQVLSPPSPQLEIDEDQTDAFGYPAPTLSSAHRPSITDTFVNRTLYGNPGTTDLNSEFDSHPLFGLGQDDWAYRALRLGQDGGRLGNPEFLFNFPDMNTLMSSDQLFTPASPETFHFSTFPSQQAGANDGGAAECWPATVKESFLLPLIDAYLARLHSTAPIFTRSYFHQRMIAQDHRRCPQFGAMLLALSAMMLIQPILVDERSSMAHRKSQAFHLMREAAKLRSIPDFGQEPSLEAVLTSYFLFGCHFGLGQDNAAWFRLQEAVTLADMMRLQDPSSYSGLTEEERNQRLRTFWILSVTERAYALQRHQSIHIRRHPSLESQSSQMIRYTCPRIHDETDAKALFGLKQMVELFDLIDERLVDCWNGQCATSKASRCANFTREHAIRFYEMQSIASQSQSGQPTAEIAPDCDNPGAVRQPTETQEVDLLISRQWLHHRMWQLCLKHDHLSVSDEKPEFRPDYVVTIAQNILRVCTTSRLSSMEVHGIGLAEKVHNVAMSLVLFATGKLVISNDNSTGRVSQSGYAPGPAPGATVYFPSSTPRWRISELLNGFLAFFALFRGGRHPYLKPYIKVMNDLTAGFEDENLEEDNLEEACP